MIVSDVGAYRDRVSRHQKSASDSFVQISVLNIILLSVARCLRLRYTESERFQLDDVGVRVPDREKDGNMTCSSERDVSDR